LTYQSIYEGDVRFEHCYRLDEEKAVPIEDKQRCWREWTQKYTYGQSRDRVEYALSRDRALGQSPSSGEGTRPRGLVFPNGVIWAPQPLSAFAPPPQLLVRDAGMPEPERTATVATRAAQPTEQLVAAPGATCGVSCGKSWVQCAEGCKGGACQPGCDERYRSCMRACF